MRIRGTTKQRELMGHIMRAANAGAFLNITQLHKLVSYECSYGAIRISVRFLIKKEVLHRMTEGNESKLVPTSLAYTWFRPGS